MDVKKHYILKENIFGKEFIFYYCVEGERVKCKSAYSNVYILSNKFNSENELISAGAIKHDR